MEASARASGGVFRDRREVSPSTCSAKVRAAVRVHAEEPAYPQQDPHPAPADRGVGQSALVGAVDLAGRTGAPRAGGVVGAGACPESYAVAADLGFLHDHGSQVRQQHLEADPVLA
jgi:hypothetical protein